VLPRPVPPKCVLRKAELFRPVWLICELEKLELRSILLLELPNWEFLIAEPPKCELEIFDTARLVEIAEPVVLAELTDPREPAAPEEGLDDLELFA
jgi:hypothetical protein